MEMAEVAGRHSLTLDIGGEVLLANPASPFDLCGDELAGGDQPLDSLG
jgi:hypothetical protein